MSGTMLPLPTLSCCTSRIDKSYGEIAADAGGEAKDEVSDDPNCWIDRIERPHNVVCLAGSPRQGGCITGLHHVLVWEN
jgi:hypothetical protein